MLARMGKRGSVVTGIALMLGVLAGCSSPAPAPTVTVTQTVTQRPSPAPTVTVTVTPPQAAPAPTTAEPDLTTDAGLCAADADMSNLELNDAIAPLLGYPSNRKARTPEQDDAIREYKNAAFERACPARAG